MDSVRNGCASTNGVVRPADSGATHQTSIGGSAEVISRSKRLSEKAREFMELASLRCFSLRQAVGSRGRGDSDSPRNSSVPHRLAIQKDWLTTDRVQLGFTQGEGVAVQNSQVSIVFRVGMTTGRQRVANQTLGGRGLWHTEAGRTRSSVADVSGLTGNRASKRCSPPSAPVRHRADSPPPVVCRCRRMSVRPSRSEWRRMLPGV